MCWYITFTALFCTVIRCGHSVIVSSQDSEYLELQNGTETCQGLVKFQNPMTNTSWLACSSTIGNTEATVICRQIGCNSSSARIVNSTEFGFAGSEFYAVFSYNCSGNEQVLSSCHSSSDVSCDTVSGDMIDPNSVVAVDCNVSKIMKEDNMDRDLNRNLMIIIMCSIFVGVLLISVSADITIIVYFTQKSDKRPRLEYF